MQANPNFMNWEKPGRALITGASSGMGAEFARRLAGEGFNLVLVARRKETLDQLANELKSKNGISVEVLAADLADPEAVDRVAARIRELNDLDVLISNAGFGLSGGFMSSDYQRMLDMIQVHDITSVVLARTALPIMVNRNRGALVFTASVAAFSPAPGMYSPTKAFLVMLAECLSMELHDTSVRVQALCPGFTHTEFHDKTTELKELKKSIPKMAWGTPAGVVNESLAGLRKNKVIVVPGRLNRFVKNAPMFLKKRVTMKHKTTKKTK
nr:SDR family oxidoreductase [Candidatus Sigynarchaeota archaeon]